MNENPILRDLETVLEYGGHEVIWQVPADAAIRPGTGPNIYHGMTITAWGDR